MKGKSPLVRVIVTLDGDKSGNLPDLCVFKYYFETSIFAIVSDDRDSIDTTEFPEFFNQIATNGK